MHWFLDWDGTVTTRDTLSVLASIGYSKNRNENLPPWSHFLEAYESDHAAHRAKHKAEGQVTTSLRDILAWQESLVDVERASVERVERSGIFANVTTADIDNAAKDAMQSRGVILRPGLDALVKAIHERDECITIVSLNWSARFIQSCLANALELQTGNKPFTFKVLANNIELGSGGRLSRVFEDEDRGIWIAQDKERVMRLEIQTERQWRDPIYVGDSPSDLLCLLLANVGICIRDEELSGEQGNLQQILQSLGVSCHWIGEYPLKDSTADRAVEQLWWAKDFHEIHNSNLFKGGIARPDL